MNRTLLKTITALIAVFVLPQTWAAYYFEATTTTEGSGMGRRGEVVEVRAWVDGANARVEFTEGDRSGLFAEGNYMLTTQDGDSIYLVNPNEMTYSELDLNELFSTISSVMESTGGVVDMEFSDVTNEKVSEGPGGEILGFSTTHYEFHTGYTMTIEVLGFGRSQHTDSEVEVWCTNEIDDAGFGVWLRPDRFSTGNEEFDDMIQAQYQELDCLPLRTRSETSSDGRGGGTTTSTTEVAVLREESSIDPAVFALPEGFTAVSLIPDMPEDFDFSQISQSTGNGSPAEEPEEEEEDDDRPFNRLRGLFDR